MVESKGGKHYFSPPIYFEKWDQPIFISNTPNLLILALFRLQFNRLEQELLTLLERLRENWEITIELARSSALVRISFSFSFANKMRPLSCLLSRKLWNKRKANLFTPFSLSSRCIWWGTHVRAQRVWRVESRQGVAQKPDGRRWEAHAF